MPTDKLNPYDRSPDNPSYASVLREVGQTAKDLVRSEIQLLSLEIKNATQKISKHSAQAAIFGGLVVLSVFPFLAFIVIGLGRLLNDRFWLSSLIVAVVCALAGGLLAMRAYRKIKSEDLDLSYTKSSFKREMAAVQDKANDIKTALRGGNRRSPNLHH